MPGFSEYPSGADEIIVLLRKLKRNTNWLLSFIVESKEKSSASAVNTKMSASELISKCSSHLRAKIMSELKGIEKRYEAKGYPLGFESIPTPEFPESSGSGADTQDKASGQRLVQMAEEVASSVDIEFQKLSSIQRKFLTHYRCEHCGLVPLYSMRFQRRRYRCGICGTAVQLGKRGKYGRLRSLIAMKLLNEAGLQEVIPR